MFEGKKIDTRVSDLAALETRLLTEIGDLEMRKAELCWRLSQVREEMKGILDSRR